MTTKHENIHQALAAVMEEVGYVKKQRSAGLNYSYAGEAALIEALRPAMVEHGVMVYVKRYFNLAQTEYETSKGSRMTRTIMQAVVTFQHESGTFIDVESAGEGADSGDKSVNKAMTGAYKYALRQTFCIETGDDPDKYPSDPGKAIGSQPKPPQPTVEHISAELFGDNTDGHKSEHVGGNGSEPLSYRLKPGTSMPVAIMEAGYAENTFEASNILNMMPTKERSGQKALDNAAAYHQHRIDGKTIDEAKAAMGWTK